MAWNRWQDLRASDAPAWVRLAAFESYLAARARIRDAARAESRRRTGSVPVREEPRPGFPLRSFAAAAAVALMIALAALAVATGGSPDPAATAGSSASATAPADTRPASGPTLDFSPGL